MTDDLDFNAPDSPYGSMAWAAKMRGAADNLDKPRPIPAVGRFLAALGVDPATATDDPPVVRIVGDRVFVTYTGLLSISPEAFLRAASVAHLPDGWIPA